MLLSLQVLDSQAVSSTSYWPRLQTLATVYLEPGFGHVRAQDPMTNQALNYMLNPGGFLYQ